MANIIKIKRSSATATPTSLEAGELAFSFLSGKLFIGNSSAVIPIGGTHSPGTLTANQALVANSTSGIDKIIVANLNIQEVYANGAAGTAGFILGSGGAGANAYWIDPSTLQTAVGGSNTHIQFNDEGDLGGQADFTFNKTTSVLTIGNSTVNVAVNSSQVSVASQLSVGTNATLTTGTLTLGNSTVNTFANSTTIDVDGNITGYRFLSSNIGLSAPVNGTYTGERVRLYDFGDNRVNYAIGVEASHVWTAVDGNSNTVGFKWYGNTVQVARLGGEGTLELKGDLYTDANAYVNVAIRVGNSTINTLIDDESITVANLVPTYVYANGAFGTAGQVLLSNSTGGVYWGQQANALDDLTDVQITAAANNDILVYNAATGQWEDHTVSGTANKVDVNFASQDITVTLANDVIIDSSLSVGNSTVNSVINSTSVSTGNVVATGDLRVDGNAALGNSFGIDVVSFNATVNTEISPSSNNNYKLGRADLRWGEVNANNVLATNVAVDSVITVGSNVTLSTSILSIGNSTVNTVINSTSVSTGTLSVANLTVTGDFEVQGNTKLGNASSDVVSFIGSVNSHIIPSANLTYSLGNNDLYWAEVHAGNVHADYGYFEHDVAIYGDLTVSGNLVTTNVQSVVISDPLIQLASGNDTSDLVDIGFIGHYHTGGANLHTGLFRDASVDEYYLFKGLTQDLAGQLTVNVADPTFALADLNAWLQSGALISNSTAVTITANSTVNVNITANSLSLSTALAVNSGGTGAATFTTNGVLFGNGTGALQVTSAGTEGQILQANSTGGPVFADLDGGTF